jgi:hypothetical protein
MKEITTEQKAKAYDKAVERAKRMFSEKELNYIFPELKDSEDGKSKKWILEYLHDGLRKSDEQFKDHFKAAISWLEKQCEKSMDKLQVSGELYEYIRNTCACIDDALSSETLADINDYLSMAERSAKSAFDMIEKQSEQKLADNVEPKYEPNFHEGDWVVYNNDICQIVKREEGCNKLVTVFGIEKELVNERNLSTARLWTVEDAKDGDVLAFYSEYRGNKMVQVGIIEKYVGKHGGCSNTFKIYVGVNWDNNLQIGKYMGCSDIRPATKEQRDGLMKAMADADYTFDFGKKELKEIEKKPAWSEEDESILQGIWDEILANKHNAKEYEWKTYDKFLDWLKSLKDRIQPKVEWSEEDEKIISKINSVLNAQECHDGATGIKMNPYKDALDWLKSIRPQKHESQSDEHYELEEFAKIVRGNLTGISKAVQELFEAKYLQLTGNKMYGEFKD